MALKDYTTQELADELSQRKDMYAMRFLTTESLREWAHDWMGTTDEQMDKFIDEEHHMWALDDYLEEKLEQWLFDTVPCGEE